MCVVSCQMLKPETPDDRGFVAGNVSRCTKRCIKVIHVVQSHVSVNLCLSFAIQDIKTYPQTRP